MIKHIVCFKLKDNSLENCQKTAEEIGMMEAIAHSHNYAKESDILPLIETVKQS